MNVTETNLLQMIYKLKGLKFVDFEDLENKYFYRVLEEEDGIYKGMFRLGQNKEGKGNKYYNDGRLYEGEWKNNKRQGKGITKRSNGSIFEGEFKDDKAEENGILKCQMGKSMKAN